MVAGIVLPSSTAAAWSLRSSAFFSGQQQQKLFNAAAPKVAKVAVPAIEAKATTRREDRVARHKRIRKKVRFLNPGTAFASNY